MKIQRRRKNHSAFSILEVLEPRIAPATFTYVGGSGNWENQNNWRNDTTNSTNGFPGTFQEDVAIFPANIGAPTITLNSSVTIKNLIFAGGDPTINGGTLVFSSASISPAIAIINPASSPVINSNIQNTSAFPLRLNQPDSEMTVNGILSSSANSGGFQKDGDGTLTIGGSAANTFGNANSSEASGAGFKLLAGVVFLAKSGGVNAIPSDLEIAGGELLTLGEQIADTAKVTIGQNAFFSLFESETVGQIEGTGKINGNVAGIKTLTLKSSSTFGGIFHSNPFKIDMPYIGGAKPKLDLTGTQPLSAPAATVTFAGGQVNVSGSYPNTSFILQDGPNDGSVNFGSLSGSGTAGIIVTTNASAVSPGTGTSNNGLGNNTGIGTLTTARLAADTNRNLYLTFDITSQGNDKIILTNPNDAFGGISNLVRTDFNISNLNVTEGQVFEIVDVPGTATKVLYGVGGDAYAEGAVVALNGAAFQLHIHYNGGDGNDIVLVAEANRSPIAPTSISASGKTATFLQDDGDTLVLKTTKGAFTAANFNYGALPGNTGGFLQSINLSSASFGSAFKGAIITGTVIKATTGDGFADVGSVNASGVDIGAFTLRGDLGSIIAGDTNFKTPGLGSLSVLSLGAKANLIYLNGAANLYTSTITGQLGALTISKGNLTTANTPTLPDTAGIMRQAFLNVIADATPANFKFAGIGRITIDTLDGSNLAALNQTINTGTLGQSTVLYTPGTVLAAGPIGPVLVKSGVTGGVSDLSGNIWSRTSIAKLTVGGTTSAASIIGGAGYGTGSVLVGSPDDSSTFGNRIGPVKIFGNLVGGAGDISAIIYSGGRIGAVSVVGNVIGAEGDSSGTILSVKGIGPITLGGLRSDLAAPGTQTGQKAGSIQTFNGNVPSITIKGAMNYGESGSSGIFITGTLGRLTVGSLGGDSGGSGIIAAVGKFTADSNFKPLPGLAIGSIIINGNVSNWDIISGQDGNSIVYHPAATVGSVLIKGNFTDSSIILDRNGPQAANTITSIASIIITGTATDNSFRAQEIKSLKIANLLQPLNPGKLNDSTTLPGNNTVSEF